MKALRDRKQSRVENSGTRGARTSGWSADTNIDVAAGRCLIDLRPLASTDPLVGDARTL